MHSCQRNHLSSSLHGLPRRARPKASPTCCQRLDRSARTSNQFVCRTPAARKVAISLPITARMPSRSPRACTPRSRPCGASPAVAHCALQAEPARFELPLIGVRIPRPAAQAVLCLANFAPEIRSVFDGQRQGNRRRRDRQTRPQLAVQGCSAFRRAASWAVRTLAISESRRSARAHSRSSRCFMASSCALI